MILILGKYYIESSTSFNKMYLNYKTMDAFQDYGRVDDVQRFSDAEEYAGRLTDFNSL